jgi:hypothetical protein
MKMALAGRRNNISSDGTFTSEAESLLLRKTVCGAAEAVPFKTTPFQRAILQNSWDLSGSPSTTCLRDV